MTNQDRYKTPEERIEGFRLWCRLECQNLNGSCKDCVLRNIAHVMTDCMAHWLALEAEEEKPEPCPFCGSPVTYRERYGKVWYQCTDCGYMSGEKSAEAEAVAAHNRVCRAVKAKESEVTK